MEKCGNVLVLDRRTIGNYDGPRRRIKCIRPRGHDRRGMAGTLCSGTYRTGFLWLEVQGISWCGEEEK